MQSQNVGENNNTKWEFLDLVFPFCQKGSEVKNTWNLLTLHQHK